eukprot:gene58303-biopygen48924
MRACEQAQRWREALGLLSHARRRGDASVPRSGVGACELGVRWRAALGPGPRRLDFVHPTPRPWVGLLAAAQGRRPERGEGEEGGGGES